MQDLSFVRGEEDMLILKVLSSRYAGTMLEDWPSSDDTRPLMPLTAAQVATAANEVYTILTVYVKAGSEEFFGMKTSFLFSTTDTSAR